jgi:hypothetical protein
LERPRYNPSGHRWRAAVAANAIMFARRRGVFGWILQEARESCGQVQEWPVLERGRKSPPSLLRSTAPTSAHAPNHLASVPVRPDFQDRDGNNKPATWNSSRSSKDESSPRSPTVQQRHSLNRRRKDPRNCLERNRKGQTLRRQLIPAQAAW